MLTTKYTVLLDHIWVLKCIIRPTHTHIHKVNTCHTRTHTPLFIIHLHLPHTHHERANERRRSGLKEPVGLKRNRVGRGRKKKLREAGRVRRFGENEGGTRKRNTTRDRFVNLHFNVQKKPFLWLIHLQRFVLKQNMAARKLLLKSWVVTQSSAMCQPTQNRSVSRQTWSEEK